MSFRDNDDAAHARADALQHELDTTESELAQAEAELAAARAQLAQREHQEQSRDAAAQHLQQMATRAPRPVSRSVAKRPEPSTLMKRYSMRSTGVVLVAVLAGIATILGFVFAAVAPVVGISVGVVGAATCLLLTYYLRPSANRRRAVEKLNADRQWVASRPYQLNNFPDAIGGIGGDTLVLKLKFSGGAPRDLSRMVQGCGGTTIANGYYGFEFGYGSTTTSDGHGGSTRMQTVEPMRARPMMTRLDGALLSPLAQAHGLIGVNAHIEMSAIIAEADADYEPLE